MVACQGNFAKMLLGSRSWLSFPLLWIGFCTLQNLGVKAQISVELEDVAIEKMDPMYFDPAKTDAFITENEEGVTTLSSHVAIIKEIPVEAMTHLALKGMSMGKYSLPTGLELNMGICEMMREQIIVGPLLASMGFSEDECPPKIGFYSQGGYIPTTDNLPDAFPENKYRGSYELTLNGTSIFSANLFLNIKID